MSSQDVSLFVLQTLVLAVMLFGLFSLVTLIIPGLVIIWVAALVYGVVTGFTSWVSIVAMVIITALMIFGSLIDNILMAKGAQKTGASWVSVVVSMIAGIAGSLLFPPFGGIVASLIGIFLVELIRLKKFRNALISTRSMAFGCGWAVVARFGMGILMIILWAGWVWLTLSPS